MGWSGPLTHRQFITHLFWLNGQWNEPSRTDHYLMSIACEVRRVLAKRPSSVQLKHFRLQFGSTIGEGKPSGTGDTPTDWTARNKSMLAAMVGQLGGKPVEKRRFSTREEALKFIEEQGEAVRAHLAAGGSDRAPPKPVTPRSPLPQHRPSKPSRKKRE